MSPAVTYAQAVYDPVLNRYRAYCPLCDWFAVRKFSRNAEHVLALHITDRHVVLARRAAR